MKGDHIQASVPAPVASLPPRQPIPSVHFSMARSVHLSMAIDTGLIEAGRAAPSGRAERYLPGESARASWKLRERRTLDGDGDISRANRPGPH